MCKFLYIVFLFILSAILAVFFFDAGYKKIRTLVDLGGIYETIEDRNTALMIETVIKNDVQSLVESNLNIKFFDMKGICYGDFSVLPSKELALFEISSYGGLFLDRKVSHLGDKQAYILLIRDDSSFIPVLFNKDDAVFANTITATKLMAGSSCYKINEFSLNVKQVGKNRMKVTVE